MHEVIRLTPNIVEVVVKAPLAARAFQPGQFYRLQNFETLAHAVDGTTLAMEGLALTGASVDREKGLLSTIVLEMGGSSDLCALLKPGEPVDPDGSDRHADGNARRGDGAAGRRRAGQRGAVLHRPDSCAPRARASSISPATRRSSTATRWRRSRRPPTSWSGAATKPRASRRAAPQDRAFVGNIVEAMRRVRRRRSLGDTPLPLQLGGPRHRHRLGRHDAAVAQRAAHRARAVSEARITRRSAASTRRCSA